MYVYLGREWELRVIFRLELQFSCWNKYWSLGWLHLKFYQLLDWLLFFFSFCWIFNPKDVNVCYCFVFFFFSSLSFSSAFSALFPILPLQLPSWNGTEPWCQHHCSTIREPTSLTVSMLLMPMLEIPKQWQTWKCLPFIFIWYLILVLNVSGSWILFPSQ